MGLVPIVHSSLSFVVQCPPTMRWLNGFEEPNNKIHGRIHLAAVYTVLFTGNFKHQYGTPSGSYHNWAQLTLKKKRS